MVLSMAPGWVWLFQECKEVTVMKLTHQGQPLTLNLPPHDLQVTLASRADDKASKFSVSIKSIDFTLIKNGRLYEYT